jgi:hypothetical protein
LLTRTNFRDLSVRSFYSLRIFRKKFYAYLLFLQPLLHNIYKFEKMIIILTKNLRFRTSVAFSRFRSLFLAFSRFHSFLTFSRFFSLFLAFSRFFSLSLAFSRFLSLSLAFLAFCRFHFFPPFLTFRCGQIIKKFGFVKLDERVRTIQCF